ncbi:hypothetical protein BGZ83_002916, partial [Gryganskiella cystojenkinii]
MKLTFAYYMAIVTCIFAFPCVRVDAQKPICDIGPICNDSEAHLDQLLHEWIAATPKPGPGTTHTNRRSLHERRAAGSTTKEAIESGGKKVIHAAKEVINDLKNNVNTYGETTFRHHFLQAVKSADAVCQTENEFLKFLKDTANGATFGGLGIFCKCMSAFRPYNTPDELTEDLRKRGATIQKPCKDQALGLAGMLNQAWTTPSTDPAATGAHGKGYYHFAHCEKGGSDWDYIQESWCKDKFGAVDSACNGPCLTVNHRYCLYNFYSSASRSNMCEFKKWCEQDGYVAKAKS